MNIGIRRTATTLAALVFTGTTAVGAAGTAEAHSPSIAIGAAPAPVSNLASPSCPTLIQQGQVSGCVTRLQQLLNSKQGAGLDVDGNFGQATYAAVRTWQSRHGLGVDGIVGPNTKASIDPQSNSGGSQVGGPISRAEVLSRGHYWVDRHVSYSMSGSHPDPQGRQYRSDCSGFVSMAWHLSTSANTVTLPDYAQKISWNQLQPGDAVGTLGAGTGGSGGHVVIFNGWANSDHTRFHTLEERGTAYGAVAYERPINFKIGSRTASPYRYNQIR